MTYYGLVGGWALKYMFSFLFSGAGVDFGAFTGGQLGLGIWQPILWNVLFMAAVWAICIFGAKGIEKASKFMMPALFVLLLLVIVRSVTLPGAAGGFTFMFAADASKFTFKAVSDALGQVFFSLSLAMGAMITYGSYLKKEEKLPKSVVTVSVIDTGAAMLAGIAIFPAVFALGKEPAGGPGLMFDTLPSVFAEMPLGSIVAVAFFLLVFFAALTSAMSLVEACSAFTIDNWKWKRPVAVTVLCLLFCILAIPNAMSFASGNMFDTEHFLLGGMELFSGVDFFANNIILPLGGLLMCIVIGWLWKPENAIAEIESTPNYVFKLKKAWAFVLKFVAPILILFVLIAQFIQW